MKDIFLESLDGVHLSECGFAMYSSSVFFEFGCVVHVDVSLWLLYLITSKMDDVLCSSDSEEDARGHQVYLHAGQAVASLGS
jgi:hypothetical protein